ncbi:DUF4384 domain-containing protein [Anaeromyxobacter oryzae]|uniref:DUF4384 domain-containing protein n=1 Tax=Anaeromyxobacter oryzae TaxID=2918170 RepID=A0ABM7WV51_9BACT|nr:DUF4384 domain-containing protein [Anaeromyxobacter oryzae]BDG03390.1 hypothetical protein AMOR_23860 [Anaeromyxobacter oryzae]
MSRCPSDLALEAHLLDPARSPLTAHLGACEECRARIARMEAEGEDFRRFVFPATVAAVEDAAAPARRPLLSWVLPVSGLLATAALALLVLRTHAPAPDLATEPPPGYVGLRGASMAIAVFVHGAEGTVAVADGAVVPADAQLRFKVRPAPDCRLWIVSVDATGQVSRLFPAAGDAVPVSEAGALPGGAVLDGASGPERIFAVCAPEALPYDAVARSAHAAAGGGADRVRNAKALADLPPAASQATLLLEKRP